MDKTDAVIDVANPPGYAAAVLYERQVRDYAFLDLPQEICGIDVLPLTLRTLVARLNMECPFLCGRDLSGLSSDDDLRAAIAAFVWHISVARARSAGRLLDEYHAREYLIRKIRTKSTQELLSGIREYIDDTFLDAPPSGSGRTTDYVNLAATCVDLFGENYGWPESAVINMSLMKLYQVLRAYMIRTQKHPVLFNRHSDRVRGDALRRAFAAADAPADSAVQAAPPCP